MAQQAHEAFSELGQKNTSAGGLITEIAADCSEQSKGIEHVSKVVLEMDRVTQQNAAGAQESASAAEHLNSQAKQMKGFVNGLSTLVSKAGNGTAARSPAAYAKRLRTVQEALRRFSMSIRIRWLAHKVHLHNDQAERAQEMLDGIEQVVKLAPYRYSDSANRLILGRHFLLKRAGRQPSRQSQ